MDTEGIVGVAIATGIGIYALKELGVIGKKKPKMQRMTGFKKFNFAPVKL